MQQVWHYNDGNIELIRQANNQLTLESRIIKGVGIIGWGGGGLEIVIIINNRWGGWNNRGAWMVLKK